MKKELYFGEKFKIGTGNIEEEALQEILKEFHIEKITQEDKNFKREITLRTLSNKPKVIKLGEIKYEINTLTNLKEEENEIYKKLQSAPHIWLLPLGLALLIFSIVLFFWREKKKKIYTPMEIFQMKMKNLPQEEWSFQISSALREFIDGTLGTKFLQGVYEEKSPLTEEDIQFLKEVDYMKYSGKTFENMRENHMEKAMDIAKKIGEAKNGEIK